MNESSTDLQNGHLVEVEYAVVDKSKKNRFTSLPALNGSSNNAINVDDDKDHPPVPPKKMLHKRLVIKIAVVILLPNIYIIKKSFVRGKLL